MGAEQWDEQVGSVADEATRLLESLRRSAQAAAMATEDHGPSGPGSPAPTTAPTAATDGEGSADDPGPAEAHDPFCQWCPLCRGAAVVRSLSPQTLERLADLAGLAATVLSDLASARAGAGAGTGAGAPGSPSAAQPGTAERSRSGSSIPVRDADDTREAPRG